jgi:uncharacterized membrane protein affecting hemolysin expression
METYRLVATVVVMLGVVVAILLFERRRARQIERDVRRMAEERRDQGQPPRESG